MKFTAVNVMEKMLQNLSLQDPPFHWHHQAVVGILDFHEPPEMRAPGESYSKTRRKGPKFHFAPLSLLATLFLL